MRQITSSASTLINPIRIVLFFCVLIALLAVLCEGRKSNCRNKKKSSNNRVINGYELKPGDFPEFVSLEIFARFNSAICSGVLIDKDVVLTAAHCVQEYTRIYVGHGIHHPDMWIQRGVKQYEAANACQSDRYDKNRIGEFYDFGVVILKEPIENAKVAALESKPIELGQRGTAVGVGYIKYFGHAEGEVGEKAWAIPMEATQCSPNNIHPSHVCFTSYDPRYIGDVCYGDSGGPVLTNGPNPSILGLVSYGTDERTCLAEKSRTVFVNVPQLKNEIEETVIRCRD